MKICSYSDKGSRPSNQDQIAYKLFDEKNAVFVVADGMGGYSYGDLAAKCVTETIMSVVEDNWNVMSPKKVLSESIKMANAQLELERLSLGVSSMGAVVVTLYVAGNNAYVAWLGDSRLYQYREGRQIFCTKDNTYVNEVIKKQPRYSHKDFEKYSSIVTRAIMGDNTLGEVIPNTLGVQTDDVFVLCTDGYHKGFNVSNLVNDEKVAMKGIEESVSKAEDNVSFIKIVMN